jgi:hypothetical protein
MVNGLFIDFRLRYRDLIVADAGESLILRQVQYAIKKSARLLGENVFIGLALGSPLRSFSWWC